MKLKDALRTLRFEKKLTGYKQLYTVWGEKLDPGNILPEYPRPQLRRDNYTILNGYWNYSITTEDTMPSTWDGQILVPFSPESVLSGVSKQLKPDEILWYERSLHIAEKPQGKRCILHFGAVDQRSEVYINRQKVAKHTNGYLPFSTDITAWLQEGDNLLSLKVTDPSETRYHSRGKQKLKRGGMFYTAQSGIWQTVWLEWVPETYIESLRITPIVDQKAVRIDIEVNEDFERQKVDELIFRVDIKKEGVVLESVASRYPSLILELEEITYWSPENPYLYDLEVTVGKDRVESYFAMRKLEIKPDKDNIPRLFLNNQPYFMKGLLDQGYWPDGLYTAPSDEALIYDIVKAKELGFNMLRKHIKIEPLRWYYHCDRLGMLVWQDMVNGGEDYNMLFVGYLPTLFPWVQSCIKDKHYRLFGRKDAEGREEWTKECISTVKLLYNSPSVVVWVPFNEAWGQFDAAQIYRRIKELDTTRLVDHASGWYDQKCGDFKSIHNYFHPLKVKAEQRPVVFSEIGGYACYVPGHSYSYQIYGYRIYPTVELLNDAYQKLFQREIRNLIKEGLTAVVYTQLSDIEDEVNGLLTYDRKICKVTPLKEDL